MQISRKRFDLETWYQLTTNRKRHDDVIDDVTWPWKVKVVIRGCLCLPACLSVCLSVCLSACCSLISLRPVISKTAQDRDSVLTVHHLPPQPYIKAIKNHSVDICTLWAPCSFEYVIERQSNVSYRNDTRYHENATLTWIYTNFFYNKNVEKIKLV